MHLELFLYQINPGGPQTMILKVDYNLRLKELKDAERDNNAERYSRQRELFVRDREWVSLGKY
jgi:hypothetical protein